MCVLYMLPLRNDTNVLTSVWVLESSPLFIPSGVENQDSVEEKGP